MNETMKVVAIVNDHKVEVKNVKKLKAKPGQVLIKMHACALCTWEQRVFTRESKMPLPFVGGHEIVGEIAEVGEGVSLEKYPIGSKVTARLIKACGKCYYCRHGEENLCVDVNAPFDPDMEIPGTGGLGEYLNVDTNQIYFLPENIPDEIAVFSEPLACVLNSIERGHLELGSDVLVLGGGIMGMLHVMCAKLSGTRVIISEPDEIRGKLALQLGAHHWVNPLEKDIVQFMKTLNNVGAEAVFNTTPISAVAKQAIEATAPLGTCVMYSSQHPDRPIEISPNWVHSSQINITGAVSPSIRSFRRSVDLLEKRLLWPDKLISGVFTLEQAQQAFETAIRPDTFRTIIKF